MRKFNSIPKHNFVLYSKECEWRFNHSGFKSQKKHNEHTPIMALRVNGTVKIFISGTAPNFINALGRIRTVL